jgi:starch phosphorylase
MRASMSQLTPRFAADRSVRQYVKEYYLPAAAAYVARSANSGGLAQDIVDRRKRLEAAWPSVHFGKVSVKDQDDKHGFQVEVYLNGLSPGDVRVELFANPVANGTPVRQQMSLMGKTAGSPAFHVYSATASASRPLSDYTPRILDATRGLAIPLEESRVLWQK